MSAVQVPAAGWRTSTWPWSPVPWGRLNAASWPFGLTSEMATGLESGPPGSAMSAVSMAAPRRTVKWKIWSVLASVRCRVLVRTVVAAPGVRAPRLTVADLLRSAAGRLVPLAGHPVEVTGRHDVDRPGFLGGAARAEGADVVAHPAVGVHLVVLTDIVLGVAAEDGGGADADHAGLRGGRPDRVLRARVVGRRRDRHAGRHGRLVGLLDHVLGGVVGEREPATLLVEDVDVVDVDRVVDGLEERRQRRHIVVPVRLVGVDGDARRDALQPDVTARGHVRRVVVQVIHEPPLRGHDAVVEVGLEVFRPLRRRALAGEVLVVGDDVLPVRPDHLRLVRVDADRHVTDGHPGAGEAELPGGRRARGAGDGVDRLDSLRVE